MNARRFRKKFRSPRPGGIQTLSLQVPFPDTTSQIRTSPSLDVKQVCCCLHTHWVHTQWKLDENVFGKVLGPLGGLPVRQSIVEAAEARFLILSPPGSPLTATAALHASITSPPPSSSPLLPPPTPLNFDANTPALGGISDHFAPHSAVVVGWQSQNRIQERQRSWKRDGGCGMPNRWFGAVMLSY